jgi:hypothetical protein
MVLDLGKIPQYNVLRIWNGPKWIGQPNATQACTPKRYDDEKNAPCRIAASVGFGSFPYGGNVFF